jgi:hypothetical protein
LRLKKGFQNLTRSANLYFLIPVLAIITTAVGSVNKPANITSIEFPCWTKFLNLRRTLFNNPARLSAF